MGDNPELSALLTATEKETRAIAKGVAFAKAAKAKRDRERDVAPSKPAGKKKA